MNKGRNGLYSLTLPALTAALLSVSALLYIPTPLPITLQTLVLFTSLFLFGGRITSVAVLIYLAIGAVGLPVFSGFSGGIARLLDATGGFLFGLLVASLLYWLLTALIKKEGAWHLFSAVLAHLLLYLVGTLWYALVYLSGTEGLLSAALVTVVPFILPDALKLLLAYVLARRLKKTIYNQ